MGGIQIAWTGGGSLIQTTLTDPVDIMAYRPDDYKGLARVEEKCKAGLPEAFHLATPDQINAAGSKHASFKTWINLVKRELEMRGMDSVFRVLDASGNESYILEEFGTTKGTKVKEWVENLLAGNIGGQGACPYDKSNLSMSGTMIHASLNTDMLRKMHNDEAGPGASGPVVLAAVIRCHQALSAAAVREMTATLRIMKLTKEPAENVETFADKVAELGKRIVGTGKPPEDLHFMIYESLKGASNAEFAYIVTELNVKANREDTTVLDWESQLSELKTIYRDFKARGQWDASNQHKEKEVAALKAAFKKFELKQQEKDGKSSENKSDKKADDRECYHCGKKGHIKPNCPDKNTPKDQLKSGTAAPSASSNGTASPKKIAPKEGEAHTKTIDGATHKWCGTCKRWTSGTKAHLTDEHVKGFKKEEKPAVGAALAVTSEDNGPSLRLYSGYMASFGTPVNPKSLVYCGVCDRFVRTDECHETSLEQAGHICSAHLNE